MAKGRIVLFGGMGFPATETAAGMFTLKPRLEAVGFEVLLIGWDQRQEAYNFMHGYAGPKGCAGDSLGAGSAVQYPGDLGHEPVQFAGGFQPSIYDARAHNWQITVAPNVVRAHCIYDPYFIDTMGLGRADFVITPGSKTQLVTTEHRGAHPDDWGYSQDLIFNDLKAIAA